MQSLWPHTVEGLAKFITVTLAIVAFLSQAWQASIRRKSEYNATLRAWGSSTLKLLHQIRFDNSVERLQLERGLDAIELAVDKGRLFFPNKKVPGTTNGWRPRILDWLVLSVELARLSDEQIDSAERISYLYRLRRRFIEDLQRILQPTLFTSTMMTLKIQLLLRSGPMDGSQSMEPIPEVLALVERL